MKNENKCFFSISLENGITITGENPEKVRSFIARMSIAIFDAHMHERENEKNEYWIKEYQDLFSMLLDAECTIAKNTKN